MNKQTKMWLGIGAVALAGYLIWKQSQKPKGFANTVGGEGGGGGASSLSTPTDECKERVGNPVHACCGYGEGHSCGFVSPRNGKFYFGRCKKVGESMSCEVTNYNQTLNQI